MPVVHVLEGAQGVGKTSLLEALRRDHGCEVLAENVLDMPTPFSAQSVAFEAQWLVDWAARVARLPRDATVWSDRGPASAVQYTRSGQGAHLCTLATQLLAQLREEHARQLAAALLY